MSGLGAAHGGLRGPGAGSSSRHLNALRPDVVGTTPTNSNLQRLRGALSVYGHRKGVGHLFAMHEKEAELLTNPRGSSYLKSCLAAIQC